MAEVTEKDMYRLVLPQNATGEVKAVYDEITRVEGPQWLVPLWGFFAPVPKLLRLHWDLLRTLEIDEGAVPRHLMSAISLVCAAAAECPRCMNYHQQALIQRLGFSEDYAEALRDFENAPEISDAERATLRFCKKVAFNEEATPEEFLEMRRLYADEQICEMVCVALFEASLARHGAVMAQFEDTHNWPQQNTPSAFYFQHMDE